MAPVACEVRRVIQTLIKPAREKGVKTSKERGKEVRVFFTMIDIRRTISFVMLSTDVVVTGQDIFSPVVRFSPVEVIFRTAFWFVWHATLVKFLLQNPNSNILVTAVLLPPSGYYLPLSSPPGAGNARAHNEGPLRGQLPPVRAENPRSLRQLRPQRGLHAVRIAFAGHPCPFV